MKVLVCHEFYRQFGGEDHSFLDEVLLLRANGHTVVEYTRHNDEIYRRNLLRVAAQSVWNASVYRDVRSIIQNESPDLIHCTNIFPLISPSVYRAAEDERVPVVQALHNYRLLCPSATLMRNGGVCESCVGSTFPWHAVRHGCYRNSRLGSAVVATMLAIHNRKGTWRSVDRFYTPSHFARDLFIRIGIPADRIDVKPNFVTPDPGLGPGNGGYAMFAGRLSPEKGITTLLSAWSELQENIPLLIFGDGPCRDEVQRAAVSDSRIKCLGNKPITQVREALRDATCLVMPSVWYETFGRTIIEAYAAGTPVVASRLGAMEELVAHEETGLLFEPGSSSSLSRAVREIYGQSDPAAMRARARREFEDNYTADQNYYQLINIYQRTIGHGCCVEQLETAGGVPK